MIDLTTFEKGMNVLFPRLDTLIAVKSRIYRLFKKTYNYRGEAVLWRPIVDLANGSTDFTESSTLAGGPTPLEARFKFKKDYGHILLDNEAVMASQGDGASASVQEIATQSQLDQHALQIKLKLLRNGGNARATILSGQGTATITLTNTEDAIFFTRGMWIVASSDDGAQTAPAGLRSGGAAVQVGKVNLQTGQISTMSGGNWDAGVGGIPAIQAGDSLFRKGDYGSAGPAGFLGLDAWFPRTDPGAADAFGTGSNTINRSIAPDKLAGMRVDVGGNLLNGIFDVLAAMQSNMDEENMSFTCLMSAKRAKELMDSVQTQGKYEPGGDARFGASSFNVITPWGNRTKVVSETGMAQDRFYIGVPEKFEIISRDGDIPHWAKEDGKVWRHPFQSDSISAYLRSMIATKCQKPNHWAIGKIT